MTGKNGDSDWLDPMLREQNEYIADDGFTSRVMKSLPVRRRCELRTPIVLGSAFLPAFVAFFVFPGAQYLVGAVSNILAFCMAPMSTAVPIVSLVVLACVVFGGIALATSET